MIRCSIRAAAAALTLALCAHAQASPLLELAGGLGGTSGLQGRVAPGGAASAYFNPALLSDVPAGLSAGIVLVDTRLSIDLDTRPRGADVPSDLGNAIHADGARWDDYPVGTDVLQNGTPVTDLRSALSARPRGAQGPRDQESYEAVGIVLKTFAERLTLGFYGLIPNSSFTQLSGFYVDEREQYFSNSLHPEMYSDRLRSLAMALAAGVRITDKLSLGAGATISLKADVQAPAYVADAGKLQDLLLNTNAKVNVGVSPHFGLSYLPIKRLRLTATLHAPQKVEFNAKFKFLLATGTEQASSARFLHDYMPWQAGAGASYVLVDEAERTVSLHGSALYGRWSGYIDRHGERPHSAYAFHDTLSGGGGMRVRLDRTTLAFDGEFKPTPVPPQTGRSNYVDNDRLGASLGLSQGFTLYGQKMSAGLSVAAYWLLTRHQSKLSTPTFADGRTRTPALVRDEVPDDAVLAGEAVAGREGIQSNNPGYPGFSSGGMILAGGLQLTLEL